MEDVKVKKEELDKDHWLREWTKEPFCAIKSDPEGSVKREEVDDGDDERKSEVGNCDANSSGGTSNKPASRKHADAPNLELREILERAETTDKTLGMCKFKCRECDAQYNNWSSLRCHRLYRYSKVRHSEPIRVMEAKHYLVKAFCHICRLCSQKVLCDNEFLTCHLKANHKGTSARDYRLKFKIDELSPAERPDRVVVYSYKAIGDLCFWKCQQCGSRFSTLDSLKRHQKRFHPSVSDENQGRDGHKLVYHECLLCRTKIRCTKRDLLLHLKRHRGMNTLEDYCLKTGCTLVNTKNCTGNEKTVEVLKSLEISKEIGNRCLFKCNICDFEGKSWRIMRLHLSTEHGLSKLLTVNSVGMYKYNLLVEGFSYQCNVCKDLMLCDTVLISRHFSNFHRHELSPFKVSRESFYHVEFESFVKDVPVQPAQSSITLLSGAIPDEGVTEKVGNLCKYACPTCGRKDFRSFSTLSIHLNKEHRQEALYDPSMVVEARYHKCLICSMIILCDRSLLFKHLRNRHRLKLAKYEKVLIRHGGEVLPSFIQYYKNWPSKDEGGNYEKSPMQ